MSRLITDIKTGYDNFIIKFGRGPLNTTKRLIWDGGIDGGYKGILATASKVKVVSDNAADAVAGGGATAIIIVGQDANGLEQSEEITLTGVTPTADSVNIYSVITDAYISKTENQSEVTGLNTGVISVYQSGTPANILVKISATQGKSLNSFYKIPSNKFGKLLNVRVYPVPGKILTCYLLIRKNGEGNGLAFNNQFIFDINTAGPFVDLDLRITPKLLYPGAEIMLLGKVDSTTGTCSAEYAIELEAL